MMINNFDQIRNLLRFERVGDFYFLQILKRRKDNPDLHKDMVVIKDYFIYSLQEYDKLIPHIIENCEINNARAYFRLNRRSSEKVGLRTLSKISNLIEQGNYPAIKNAYSSAAGECNSETYKTWIVDFDDTDQLALAILMEGIKDLCNQANQQGDIIALIPTRNGYHIITRPFNVEKFRKEFPISIDIHKDNPTILYVP